MAQSATASLADLPRGILDGGLGLLRRVAATRSRYRANQRSSGGIAAAAATAGENVFKVFVVGTSGSGKTTFLASLYNSLSVQRPDVGFYLDVPDRQRKLLVRKYQHLADPHKDWPAGTLRREVSEWVFGCMRSGSGGAVRLFDFNYYDYAGETLTEAHEGSGFEPAEAAHKADSILVLLDGQKVLRFMAGEPDRPPVTLQDDLDHLLPLVQKLADKPVHFVISKWDVIDGLYHVSEIRERLLQHDRFRMLIDQRRRSAMPTRLIPMSALGPGFARLDERGLMVKRPDAPAPQPFQVEMSIACTLMDGFQAAAQRLSERERNLLLDPRQFLRIPVGIGRLGLWLARLVSGSLPALPFNLSAAACSALISALDAKLRAREEDLQRDIDVALSALQAEGAVLDEVMLTNLLLLKRLDWAFPGSDLLT